MPYFSSKTPFGCGVHCVADIILVPLAARADDAACSSPILNTRPSAAPDRNKSFCFINYYLGVILNTSFFYRRTMYCGMELYDAELLQGKSGVLYGRGRQNPASPAGP